MEEGVRPVYYEIEGSSLSWCWENNNPIVDAVKKSFRRQQGHLGFSLAFGLLMFFLFLFPHFLHQLAFTVAMQLGAGLVDAIFGVGRGIAVVIEPKKWGTERLGGKRQ